MTVNPSAFGRGWFAYLAEVLQVICHGTDSNSAENRASYIRDHLGSTRVIWQSVCTKVGDFAENTDICKLDTLTMKRYQSLAWSLLAAVAVLALAVSCKDKEETDTKPSLSGMTFQLDKYARAKEKITVRPYGVVHPDGGTLKYYIKASSGVVIDKPDTIEVKGGITKPGEVSFTFALPDSIADYTITCTAMDVAGNYYTSGVSNTITLVRPYTGGSLTGDNIDPLDDHFLDPRYPVAEAERKYYFTTIGGLEWFRNNLAYPGAGAPFGQNEVMSYSLGRYYTYDEAVTACPEGWRLPTDTEWVTLCNGLTGKSGKRGETLEGAAGALMADVSFNGTKMWEYWPAVKITDAAGLAVIPAGYANKSDAHYAFVGIQNYAAFWTADLSEDGTRALYRYFNVNSPDIFAAYADRHSFAASVRCVR